MGFRFDGSKTAVLLLNSDAATAQLSVNFKDIPGVTCTKCSVRDIWNHKDLGSFTGSYQASVDTHDAAFVVVTPATSL